MSGSRSPLTVDALLSTEERASEKSRHPEPDAPRKIFSMEDLFCLAEGVLRSAKVPGGTAKRVADVLVDAEARGIASHGLVRLPSYVRRVRAGLIDIAAEPSVSRRGEGCALVDGSNAFGVVAADLACLEVEKRARSYGVGWVTAVRSNHLSSIGYFARALAKKELIAFMWSNAAPSVAAYNGTKPILGTNPLSIGAPRDPNPIVLDMSTSAAARGRIRRAMAEGRPIPTGWAVDRNGESTLDPAAALEGALLPLGGAKGYGLSVFVDLLSGVLGGGASLDQVYETTENTRPADIAFTLVAADPFQLTDREQYAAGVESFVSRLKSSGDGSVLLPGELEDAAYARAQSDGIAVAADIIHQLEGMSL